MSNFKSFLIFIVVLVVLLWLMPMIKVDAIGDFFEKLIKPLGVPLSIAIGLRFGLLKYKEFSRKDEP